MTLSKLKELYKNSKEQALEEYKTFLRFPSISSEKEYTPQLLECASWLFNYVKEIGFTCTLWKTEGHPVLFASRSDAGPNRPTLLIYNHYDVQPVDPLNLWHSPPFEPVIRNGQIYARGAQDNKGQCFYVLQALKLLIKKEGKLPINIKLIIEGEEETGSACLSEEIKKRQRELAADLLAIVDVGIPRLDAPALTLGVRGILTMDIELTGSNTDLHSGSHGGIVYNPIHALVKMLAALRDEQGRMTVPGFYDEIKTLSKEEKEPLHLAFDEVAYQNNFGARPTGGENGYSPYERAWFRPTLEVNGIWGGYTGTGFKTVIPAKAHAKLSCRLVPDQDPLVIGNRVAAYLQQLTPPGIELKVDIHSGVGGAVRSPIDSFGVRAFSKAYEEVFGKRIGYSYEGASIPIINELKEASQAEVVLVGLGLPDDHIHAPNEHFGIDRLEIGALIMARAIELIGEQAGREINSC